MRKPRNPPRDPRRQGNGPNARTEKDARATMRRPEMKPCDILAQGNRIWKDLREFAGLAGLRSDRFYLWRRESSLWRRYWNSLWHAGRNWMIREPGTRLFTISTNS